MTELRRVTADDWALLRDVRLRALADSPDSFGALHADAAVEPESSWRRRAGGPYPTLVAVEEGRGVAMAGARLLPESRGVEAAEVWGMWTDPAARGRGLGAALLDALLAWADARGLPVALDVTEGNDAAAALYRSRGFEATGSRVPLRAGSTTYAAGMRRPARGSRRSHP